MSQTIVPIALLRFYLVALDALASPLLQVRRSTFGPGGRAMEALAVHRGIVERVSEKDAEGARESIRRHLQDVEAAWERMAGQN
jgi:DNA-binding FadR family transcriptional regulator